MENVAEIIGFVNAQASFHAKKANEFAKSNPRRSEQHAQLGSKFAALADFLTKQAEELEQLRTDLAARPIPAPVVQRQLELRLEDIDGLPDELIQELSITDGDRMDFTLQALMNEHGGVMSLDQLLIAIYRKTGEIQKRTNLNARLYRMATKGDLFNVTGRKGVYSTRELTDEEVKALG